MDYNPELKHMVILDGEWHKTAQGNMATVAFLTAEAFDTCLNEVRQKESTRVTADCWQEAEAALGAGNNVVIRESFNLYVSKLFKDEVESLEIGRGPYITELAEGFNNLPPCHLLYSFTKKPKIIFSYIIMHNLHQLHAIIGKGETWTGFHPQHKEVPQVDDTIGAGKKQEK